MAFLAIAIFEVKKGREEECLALCRELYAYLHEKGYSQDVLYRDSRKPRTYFDIRMWASKASAVNAHQDPEVQKFWARLSKVSKVKKVHDLEKLPPDVELLV